MLLPCHRMRSATCCVCFLIAPCASAQDNASRQSTTSAPPALSSIIESVRPSIVLVSLSYRYRVQENPNVLLLGGGSGTGFIVDSAGHIATADHVVSLTKSLEGLRRELAKQNKHIIENSVTKPSIQVRLPVPNVERDPNGNEIYNNWEVLHAQTFVEDDLYDIAVLICDNNPLTKPSSFNVRGKPLRPPAHVAGLRPAPPHDGDTISVSGFPLGIPGLVTNSGHVANPFFIDEHGRSLYLGDISVNPGNSGGPAYSDADGGIIGYVIEYRPAPDGSNSRLAVIVPIRRVLDLLNKTKSN